MTNYSLNVIPDTWTHYEHPWYTQLDLLGNSTTSESQSQQKHKSEATGVRSTSYCYLCKQHLPLDQFYRNKSRRCGVQYQCKTCQQKYQKLRSQQTLPLNQTCELCTEQPAEHWDHLHATDEHRGWLCKDCNTGIGMFKEDISLFYKAINYLSTTNGSQI